jgi:hypothetical protein
MQIQTGMSNTGDGNARKSAEFRYFQDKLLCKFNEIKVTSEFSGSATSTIDVDLVDDTPASKRLKLLADINSDQYRLCFGPSTAPSRLTVTIITSFYLKYPPI